MAKVKIIQDMAKLTILSVKRTKCSQKFQDSVSIYYRKNEKKKNYSHIKPLHNLHLIQLNVYMYHTGHKKCVCRLLVGPN